MTLTVIQNNTKIRIFSFINKMYSSVTKTNIYRKNYDNNGIVHNKFTL